MRCRALWRIAVQFKQHVEKTGFCCDGGQTLVQLPPVIVDFERVSTLHRRNDEGCLRAFGRGPTGDGSAGVPSAFVGMPVLRDELGLQAAHYVAGISDQVQRPPT